MATGPAPVATVAGFNAVKLPEIGLIFSGLIVFERVPKTYT